MFLMYKECKHYSGISHTLLLFSIIYLTELSFAFHTIVLCSLRKVPSSLLSLMSLELLDLSLNSNV